MFRHMKRRLACVPHSLYRIVFIRFFHAHQIFASVMVCLCFSHGGDL